MIVTIRRQDHSKIGMASGDFLSGGLWRAIQKVVGDEFNVEPDDVELSEIPDGENEGAEAVVVDGNIVGFIHQEFSERSRMTFQYPVAAE